MLILFALFRLVMFLSVLLVDDDDDGDAQLFSLIVAVVEIEKVKKN